VDERAPGDCGFGPSHLPDIEAEYVLPILRRGREDEQELLRYIHWLSRRVDVTVVDASDGPLFTALHQALPAGVQHRAPHYAGLNGKARGVMTGLDVARWEHVIIADDDVRYDDESLHAVLGRLDRADLVRPQNIYTAHPWHARWDTARMLVGRALGGDFGGTLGIRRSAVQDAGGYDTDVLFENLELERTIRAAGGQVVVARDIFVPRIPPTSRHFRGQRVRQAYDDFAQPARLMVELAILPLFAFALARKARSSLLAFGLMPIAIAEFGRRRDGGATRFPADTILWTPFWMLERAVTVWFAFAARLRGGVVYAGRRVPRAATPRRVLRLKHGAGWRAQPVRT
jgi:hypothetical protein